MHFFAEHLYTRKSFFLGEAAFMFCSSLRDIVINDGVAHIFDCAFYGCSSLMRIDIPKSVNHIGYNAFNDCPAVLIYH